MKLSKNHKLIKKNKQISQIILYTSLSLLLIGFLLTINNKDLSQTLYAYLILIPAYILVQVSIYMANRWGRSPRPDEIILQSLKGLDDRYTLYIYTTKIPFLLISPAGLFIIKPYHQSGTITYNSVKSRYEQEKGGNFFTRLFGQERIPDIEKESKYYLKQFDRYISDQRLDIEITPKIINVFFSEKADIQAKNAPEVTIHADRLKDFIRQQSKPAVLSEEEVKRIRIQLPNPDN